MEEGRVGVKEDEKFWDTTWVHSLPVRIKRDKGEPGREGEVKG